MKKKISLVSLIFILSVILAYIMYVNAVINADDTGTYVYMYNYFELGNFEVALKDILNPWFLSSAVSYLLNIGGNGSTISIAYLAVWYGIAVFLTLLIINNSIENKWLLALAFFILIPYEGTNRYHMSATVASLLFFWGVQHCNRTKKKWGVILGIVAVLYAFLFSSDRVIVLLFVGSTIVLYYGMIFIQDSGKQKFLYALGFLISIAALVIRYVDIIANLGITSQWGGYGGSSDLTWINIATLFDKGIPSLFASLVKQWNIPAKGGMIQFTSFYWIVRIVIIILAFVALVSGWMDIVRKGIKNVDLTDALSVICVTTVFGVNVLNGMIIYFSIDNADMNRYASICWFLLVFILVRWIDNKYSNKYICKRFTTNIALTITFMALSMGYINPIYRVKYEVINEYSLDAIKFLENNEDAYHYGLASYWKSSPITAATNGKFVVDSGWIEDAEFEKPAYGNYYDGTAYYNFIISDIGRTMTISEENIEEIRGDYIDRNEPSSNEIFLYDYDIRFDERLVMECWPEGGDYELTDDITYHLEFPIGTNRIHMTVGNSENFKLSIDDNPDVAYYTVQVIDDNTVYVDLICTQNTTVNFNVGRKADDYTTIHKICLKRVLASVVIGTDVTNYNQVVYLKEGSYVITFDGTDIKNMQVDWSGADISVTQLTDGRIKRRYQIDVPSDQIISFSIAGSESMVIDKISYENAVLFDEDEE